VYLPDGDHVIDIPPGSSSANYEPLIEAVWKMFLNVHAFCYQDFLQINDHHHLSTIMMALFSRTIYEKWYVKQLTLGNEAADVTYVK